MFEILLFWECGGVRGLKLGISKCLKSDISGNVEVRGLKLDISECLN